MINNTKIFKISAMCLCNSVKIQTMNSNLFSPFSKDFLSPFCHPNNKWGQFYWIWALKMSPGDFLNSFFPAVECKLPLQDLTFGQNKIIVIVHNSNDPRNCLVYSVISSRDTNIDIALLEPVTQTIAICERIRNCLLLDCLHQWHGAMQSMSGCWPLP